jgi:ribosomal protein S18 acetylase RimI-like enzyme
VIRVATEADLPALHELWQEFYAEVPEPEYVDLDLQQQLDEIDQLVRDGGAVVADNGGELLGFAFTELKYPRVGFLTDLYVRERARRRGVAAALMRETSARLRERGASHVQLEVLESNTAARAVYERWGFWTEERKLAVDLDTLERRLARSDSNGSFGSIHVQTDDRAAVARNVAKYLPRFGHSDATEISDARNGWIAVYDELCDRDPTVLQKLARELSYATGAVTLAIGVEHGDVVRYALYDRGGIVDEYLSVPEYYGALPPGDVVALGANPTVVSRLTGAEPARIRAVALTGRAPSELPPAEELLREIADAMGIEGADRRFSQA